MYYVRSDLQDANRFHIFIQGLDNQQLHPFRAGIFDRANCGASHSTE
jgi:hypothetical protein